MQAKVGTVHSPYVGNRGYAEEEDLNGSEVHNIASRFTMYLVNTLIGNGWDYTMIDSNKNTHRLDYTFDE